MYGIFTYIDHKNHPNAGKCATHGVFGMSHLLKADTFTIRHPESMVRLQN